MVSRESGIDPKGRRSWRSPGVREKWKRNGAMGLVQIYSNLLVLVLVLLKSPEYS